MEMNMKLEKVIARLEEMPKQGASYDHKGRHGWANPIRQDTGPLLEAIVLSHHKPKKVLEIGTAHGLSGCYISRWLPEGSSMVSIEWDETRATEAQANFNEAGLNVQVKNGDAMAIIPTLEGPFDIVFMDANKDGYLEQIELLKSLGMLSEGCAIIADNVIDRQKECQNFLDWMTQYPHIILKTECGLLVGRV